MLGGGGQEGVVANGEPGEVAMEVRARAPGRGSGLRGGR